jgi:hypothetical protein
MHIMVPLWGANRGGSPTAWSTMVVGGLTDGVSTVGGCAVRRATLARPYG